MGRLLDYTLPSANTVLCGPVSGSAAAATYRALTIADGATGTGTVFTQGSVVLTGASGIYTQDNANFFYDATNHRLGIGTAAPTTPLTVNGTATATIFAVPTAGAFTYNAANVIIAQTALYNYFLGNSGNLTGSGTYNFAMGYTALNALTSGSNNTAMGSTALYANTTGGNNTAVGVGALAANISSASNTAVGYSACINSTAANNTGIGAYALGIAVNTGHENTAIGVSALSATTSAVGNTAIGYNAGAAATTGGGNTLVGYTAGAVGTNVVTSTNCTLLGMNAQQSSDGLTNSTALGYGAVVTASNQVVIGNTSVTAVKINGTATAYGLTVTAAPTFAALTLGSVPFASTAGLIAQDNTNFFWDATNHRLGIGTTAPLDALNVDAAVTTVYRGNVLLHDTTAFAAGVGGQINFGGYYSATQLTEWAGIQGVKIDGTTGHYGGNLLFRTRVEGGALATAMTILGSGNVGIGTTAPTSPLQVVTLPTYTSNATAAAGGLTAGAFFKVSVAGEYFVHVVV